MFEKMTAWTRLTMLTMCIAGGCLASGCQYFQAGDSDADSAISKVLSVLDYDGTLDGVLHPSTTKTKAVLAAAAALETTGKAPEGTTAATTYVQTQYDAALAAGADTVEIDLVKVYRCVGGDAGGWETWVELIRSVIQAVDTETATETASEATETPAADAAG